ncbi:MAG: PIN domain-containing protein [Gemmatimonadetes bacterium]|nr:PIN domain-containing protein [Gemmatimonadota bacterium]
MIYLDTHVVVWLYAGQTEKLSENARSGINENDIYVSPIVSLELQYLLEIKRITPKPQTVISALSEAIGLNVCDKNFYQIVQCAQQYSWTRDPFDRIIVAQAGLNDNILVTKDQTILTHFEHAVW